MEKEKKSRKPLIVILIVAVLVLGVALTLLLTQWGGPGGDAEPSTEPSETQADGTDELILYWNIDRDLYDGKAGEAVTARVLNEDDGLYHISLAFKGRASVRRTSSAVMAARIDNYPVMGLELDDSGLISAVHSVEELTGVRPAGYFYVQNVDGSQITVNSTSAFTGVTKTYTLTDSTFVYDVSPISLSLGAATDILADDYVYLVQDKNDQLLYCWVVSRSRGELRYCDHCEQEVMWYGWLNEKELPTGNGHYFLTGDVNVNIQQKVAEGASVVLDLDGYTVTGTTNQRVYSLYNENSYLAIMDSSEEQTGRIVGYGEESDQGICVWLRYNSCTFELYGGTLDGSNVDCRLNGAAICVNGTFNMYGGTIIGGTVKGQWDGTSQKVTNGLSGSVHLNAKAVMNLYGGTITGGKALAQENYANNTMGQGFGGNIFVANEAVLNMYGGEITDGWSERGGGNVFVYQDAVFNMYGGKISGGSSNMAGRNGGNVFVNAKGVFNMEDGEITDGSTLNCAGNVYCNGSFLMSGGKITGGKKYDADGKLINSNNTNLFIVDGVFKMSGGYIAGHAQLITTGTNEYDVTISGTAQIKDAAEGYANLYIPSGHPIHVGTMEKGAEVHVTAGGYFTTETKEANKNFFRLDYDDVGIVYDNKCLFAGKYACLCGAYDGNHIGECEGQLIAWAPWTSKTSLPTSTGNYYLLYDVDMTGIAQVEGEQNIVLDLNGKTVKNYITSEGVGKRIYSLFDTEAAISLTLVDSSKEQSGNFQITGDNCDQGLAVWLRGSRHTLSIYAGTYDASKATSTVSGVAICSATGTDITMWGGTVIGGTAALKVNAETGKVSEGNGGTMYINGTMTMHGGTVTGGTAANYGGNIVIAGNGKLIMNAEAAQITDGYAANHGGNITCLGSIELLKGTVSGGEVPAPVDTYAGSGGNICVNTTGTFLLDGATIKNGIAGGSGGNIHLFYNGASSFVIKSGLVTGGKANKGGNIYLSCSNISDASTLDYTISGGTIENGEATDSGGNIYINQKALTVTVSGDAVITKGSAPIGGNFRVDNATLAVNGEDVQITEGIATKHGGNMNINAGAQLLAGTISGGTAANGGNISLNTSQSVVIDGAIIEDGTATGNGGNIWAYNAGATQIKSGALNGGTAGKGGNLWIEAGTVTVSGGTVDGGTATSGGKNAGGATIYNKGTLNIEGNAVIIGGNVTIADTSEVTYAGGATIFNTGTVNMSGGTVKAGYVLTDVNLSGSGGGAVWTGGTFNMSGGTITGYGTEGGNTSLNGGNVLLAAGTFNMTGGTIENGCSGNGGNVRVNSGTFTMDGANAVIRNGVASSHGGNLVQIGGTVILKQGTITGGECTATNNGGGNVSINTAGTFTLDGATVSNGKAGSNGGNLYIWNNSGAKVYIKSGTISDGTANNGGNIHLNIGATVEMSGGTISGGETPAYGGSVMLNAGTFTMTGGTITGGKANGSHGGNILVNGSANLVLKGGTISDGYAKTSGGNLSVNTTGAVTLDGTTISGGTSGTNGGNIWINAVSEFKIVSGEIAGGSSVTGGSIYQAGATVTMTGGTITGGKATSGSGGNIRINNGTFTMSGGTIEKGYSLDHGGNVTIIGGTVKLQGGTITDGSGKNGGNMSINTGGTVEIDGVTIQKGTATGGGGNIYIFNNAAAKITIKSGTITEGKAAAGGNIQINKAGLTVNMTGGTISNGTSTGHGGGVYLAAGAFNMTGGTISGNSAANRGGAVYIAGGSVTVDGGIIDGNQSTDHGGNVFIVNGANLTLNSGKIINGVAGNTAGNIYVFGNFTMNGGEVYGGSAKTGSEGSFANIYMVQDISGGNQVNFTMTGGKISGYVSVFNYGGTAFNRKTAVLNISGSAQITGGTTNLTISNDQLLTLGELTEGAMISITQPVDNAFAENVADSSVEQFFASDSGYDVVWENEKLYLREPAP